MNTSLKWLGASLFLWGVGESMFLPFQPLYLQQLGAGPLQIGVILGAFGAAMTITHIPAGHLSDRIGRRPILIAAWVMGVLATFVMGMARSLPALVVGMLFYGLTALVASPLDSYTTAGRGNWSVGRAMTFISMMFNGGAIVGPLLGGRIAEMIGFRSLYLIAGCIFVISTVTMLRLAPQPRDHHDPENPPAGLFSNRGYLGFLSIFFFVVFAAYLPQPLTPNFLQNQQNLSLARIGQLVSIGYLGVTILNLLLGQLEARTGFLLGQIGVAAFAAMLWRGGAFEWFAVGYFLLGGFRAMRSLGMAQIRNFVHGSQMGLAYGVAETLGASTTLLAPPLAGYLYSRDPATMYPAALVLIALGLALTVAFVPRTGVLASEHAEVVPDI